MSEKNTDRYISFLSLDCDEKARRITQYIERYAENSSDSSTLPKYFQTKLKARISLGQDELFFTCSQINTIRALFEEHDNPEALDLLEQVEQDCC